MLIGHIYILEEHQQRKRLPLAQSPMVPKFWAGSLKSKYWEKMPIPVMLNMHFWQSVPLSQNALFLSLINVPQTE